MLPVRDRRQILSSTLLCQCFSDYTAAPLVDKTGRREFLADHTIAQARAGFWAGTAKALSLRNDIGPKLGVRLTPFALASFFANALAGVAQLRDQTGLLILGEGPGDLAHHLPRRVVACGQIIPRGRQ